MEVAVVKIVTMNKTAGSNYEQIYWSNNGKAEMYADHMMALLINCNKP